MNNCLAIYQERKQIGPDYLIFLLNEIFYEIKPAVAKQYICADPLRGGPDPSQALPQLLEIFYVTGHRVQSYDAPVQDLKFLIMDLGAQQDNAETAGRLLVSNFLVDNHTFL